MWGSIAELFEIIIGSDFESMAKFWRSSRKHGILNIFESEDILVGAVEAKK